MSLSQKKKKQTKQTNKKKTDVSYSLSNSKKQWTYGTMEQIIWENFNPHN